MGRELRNMSLQAHWREQYITTAIGSSTHIVWATQKWPTMERLRSRDIPFEVGIGMGVSRTGGNVGDVLMVHYGGRGTRRGSSHNRDRSLSHFHGMLSGAKHQMRDLLQGSGGHPLILRNIHSLTLVNARVEQIDEVEEFYISCTKQTVSQRSVNPHKPSTEDLACSERWGVLQNSLRNRITSTSDMRPSRVVNES